MTDDISFKTSDDVPPPNPTDERARAYWEWLRGRSAIYRPGQGWIRLQTRAQRLWAQEFYPRYRAWIKENRERERAERRAWMRDPNRGGTE